MLRIMGGDFAIVLVYRFSSKGALVYLNRRIRDQSLLISAGPCYVGMFNRVGNALRVFCTLRGGCLTEWATPLAFFARSNPK